MSAVAPSDDAIIPIKTKKAYVHCVVSPAGMEQLEGVQCEICKSDLKVLCTECTSNPKEGGCHVSEGVCAHIFHKHCIDKWKDNPANASHTCPRCATVWGEKTVIRMS